MAADPDQEVIARADGPRFLLEARARSSRAFIFPIILGVVGAAILCALGVWQLQRLEWKEGILQEMEARLAADIVEIPANPTYETDNYRKVEVSGNLSGDELHVLTSRQPTGPGFRVIRKLETLDGRDILVDLGYVPETEKKARRQDGAIIVLGNLIWPDEKDWFTPLPNPDKNIWFAREVERMADALGTLPIMVAARETVPETEMIPMPVTLNIKNDHLEYAITWFGLMAVWILMTLYLLLRIKRDNA